MKLSEIKGERALEVIADLIDPIKEIMDDDRFKATIDSGSKLDVVKFLLKEHKHQMLVVLALLNNEDPSTYEPSLLSLPMMVMDLISDPDVMSLFGLQDQNTELASTGPVTENIEA